MSTLLSTDARLADKLSDHSLVLQISLYHPGRACPQPHGARTEVGHNLIAVALEGLLKNGPALQVLPCWRCYQIVPPEFPEDGVPVEYDVHPLDSSSS